MINDNYNEAYRIVTTAVALEDDASRIAVAQVHATLALADEQRIANRIALAVAIRGDLKLGSSAEDLSDWLDQGGGVVGYFSESEQMRLGL